MADAISAAFKKAPYRALTIPERDALFAFYEKHGGNMEAMSRDHDCLFKANSQIRYYAKLHNFHERLIGIKRKRAEEVLAGLQDSKVLAIRQAVKMIEPKLVPLRRRDGSAIEGQGGQPIFVEVAPDSKEIKTAWEIIKTELGEPTTISKAEVNNPQSEEVSKALDVISQLARNGGTRTNQDAVQGERGAAGDTTEVSPAVRHHIHEEQPA